MMFLRTLLISGFIMTVTHATLTMVTHTANSGSSQAELTMLSEAMVSSREPMPPTLSGSAHSSTEPTEGSVDPVTSAVLSDSGSVETLLTDRRSPASSSTSPEYDSTTLLTNRTIPEIVSDTELKTLVSPTSPGEIPVTPLSNTVSVSTEIFMVPVRSLTVSLTSPKNDSFPNETVQYVTSNPALASVKITTSPSTHDFTNTMTASDPLTTETSETYSSAASPTPAESYSTTVADMNFNTTDVVTVSPRDFIVSASPEMNSASDEIASFQITAETFITPRNEPSVSLTNTQNESVASSQVTMEGVMPIQNPVVSYTSQENDYTTIIPSPEGTEPTGTFVHKHISSTSPEGDYPTSVMPADRITMETSADIHTVSSTSPEGDYTTTVIAADRITMETSADIHTVSSENGYATSVILADYITMEKAADIGTVQSTSLEYDSTTPGRTSNDVTVETLINPPYMPTVFPTSKIDFSTPTTFPRSLENDFTTPVGTSAEPVTTAVYNPIASTSSIKSDLTPIISILHSDRVESGVTSSSTHANPSAAVPTDADTDLSQGPVTIPGSEKPSIVTLLGNDTGEMSTKQTPGTPVIKAPAATTARRPSWSVPTGPAEGISRTMTTVMSDHSSVTATTTRLPISSTGLPAQSSSGPAKPDMKFTTRPTTTVPHVRPGGFCTSNPCPFNSICLELGANFNCLCLAGSYFTGGHCVPARVFPGTLHIKGLTFQSEMNNRSSRVFQEMARRISQELRMALMNQPGYVKSTVLELRKGSVVASVDNVFNLASNATQQSTSNAIDAAIKDCPGICSLLTQAEFRATDLCKQELAPCDLKTTNCMFQENGTTMCICKEGYIPSFYSNITCAACLSGQRAKNGKCVPCSFGYAGFNCSDSSLLALVVLSCVLGGLLLILLLAFIVYCLRRPPPKSDYHSSYSLEELREVWPHPEVIHIPRANRSWNPAQLEMMENSNADSLPSDMSQGNGATGSAAVPEDMGTFKGKNSSRYSYLVQGHQNPYFVADDAK